MPSQEPDTPFLEGDSVIGPLPKAAESDIIYISPRAYLKSIWSVLKAVFCEPFHSKTVIDLRTGEIVRGGK